MREALLYTIYSGQLFFIASGLFVAAVIADRFPRARRVAGFVILLSIPLLALSGTLLPALLAGLAMIGYLFQRRFGAMAILVIFIGIAFEAPYHRMPQIPRAKRLFVIGDSLSSGGFGESKPWPALLNATNLALPSDDTAGALANQLPQLPPAQPGDVVIIEIGGNDMLEGKPFAKPLDQLLERASAGRRVVMLELPLLPGRWTYGAEQRRLARKHGVALIPKRVLAAVLVKKENTFDGIHLTQAGHVAMARAMR